MKRLTALMALGGVVFALTACGSGIHAGYVVSKEDIPPHNATLIIPLVMSTGKTTTVLMIPWIVHYDQAYRLNLRYCDKPDRCKRGHVYVSEDTYSITGIGDWYSKQKGDRTTASYVKPRKA